MRLQSNFALAFAVITSWCCASIAQAQFFIEADAVGFTRNNSGATTVINGADSVKNSDGSFSFEPGYRLGGAWVNARVQVEAIFTQVSPWESSSSGSFGSDLFFDQGAAGFDPSEIQFTKVSFLNEAANSFIPGANEHWEREYLKNARYATETRTNYRDFEFNVGTSQYARPWRVAIGFRNIELSDKNVMSLSGDFDAALDPADPVSGEDGGLSHAAITATGAQLLSGSGGFLAPTDPTANSTINYQLNGNARNSLNGAQFLFAYRFFDGDWFNLEGIGKAGIYRNDIKAQVRETVAGTGINDSVYQRYFSGNDASAAFAGNLGLKATVGITDYIDLLIGYEVLFLNGIALGPNQVKGISKNITGDSTYKIKNDGSLIANGGTIGLRVYW
ncbi:hypothetical protein SH668x_000661 [Planctomicrobium sp. SH668]|uniref:hypothetical protein n=1 Tax=Planctomicrobium sp. SH668 TaxID=3448126 RepID=UPI003F5B466A